MRSVRTPRRRAASLLIAAALAAVVAMSLAAAARSRISPSGLSYSSASAAAVQPQPPAGTCHARGAGIYALPDRRCTPGTLNPAVTQGSIGSTICRRGWTATVRPPVSITGREKRASLRSYGESGTSGFEYDHLVALELGGAVNDPRNLWPEPDYPVRAGFDLNPKDHLERALNRLVCSGRMPLALAQRLIATDWVSAFRRYG